MICTLIKVGDEPHLLAPIQVETVSELISYFLGFYTSLFAGAEVKYLDQSRSRFIYTVLRDGYDIPLATGTNDLPVVDLDTLQIDAEEITHLDHGTYRDPHAWKLMTGMFLATLEDN